MGFIFEIAFELVFYVLAIVASIVIAEFIYSVWVAVRWAMSNDRGTQLVSTPDGDKWSVRCTWRPWPSDWPVSGRLFAARSRRPGDPSRSERHWLHPKRMADRFDDAIIVVAPIFVVLVVLGLAIFLVETIVLVVIVTVLSTWRFICRRSWRVELVSPGGIRGTRTGLANDEAQRVVSRLRSELAAGRQPDLDRVSADLL